MNELDFIPLRGKEAALRTQTAQLGVIGFATDTGKIFLDVLDETTGQPIHKAIGGSGAAILYATASLEELPNGWVRFNRNQLDDEEASTNDGDLIINSDGKFLKVVDNTDPDFIICAVIAVSGTGGGGGGDGPDVTAGSAKIEYAAGTSANATVLIGRSCPLAYNLIATDAAGDPILNAGEATWAVSNVVKHTEQVYPGANSFDIGPYLNFGYQTVTLKIVINTGGETPTTVRKSWNVTATELRAEWDYNIEKKNTAGQDATISWKSYGSSLDKTAHIVVDQIHRYSQNLGTITNASSDFTIPGTILNHGMHEVELYLSATLNGENLKTDTIKHQMLFIDNANPTPVIAIGNIPNKMSQYNTLKIPIVVYDTTKVGLPVEVIYYENDIEIGRRNDIVNGEQFDWNYTPTTFGYRKLTIASGITKYNIDLTVEEIDLGSTVEVPGYAFRLKASEFSDNESVQNWNSNGVTLDFSENFDWINGGLKSETYDAAGNTRSYINVRAGDTMTIKYEPFVNNVTTEHGKCVKVIFKVTQCRDYDAEVIKSCVYTSGNALQRGFVIGAQNAIFKSQNNTVNIPYCEDTYIELEIDITPKGTFNYITSWIDGVPSSLTSFTADDNFNFNGNIIIGSLDADVQIYGFKVYEKHLTDTEHLSNFIMDAPNASEMMARFKRNNIVDDRGEIDPTLLAKNNPGCRTHCYEIPYMTTSKDVKVKDCNYIQYHGSENAVLTATGVTTRVQGTSSAAYGPAAFNIDADFKNGFDYPDGSHTDKWAMDKTAIPVSYLTTKVNVASCENGNNARNQEWYNRFQPYVSPNRRRIRTDGKLARDCMQFYPGVLFIKDHNKKTNEINAVDNNVFKDTPGYVDNPYFKLYAICNMGNSKKNVEVFHDIENPLECCIEVADNQQQIQRMTVCCGLDTYGTTNTYVPLTALFDADGNNIEVEYNVLDAAGNVAERRKKTAYELWRNVNMSKAGFEFRYPDGFDEGFEAEHPTEARQALIGWFNFVKWMADCNPAAATNQPFGLDENGEPISITYGEYTFKGNGFADTLKGTKVTAYRGTYTADTENYRMAKMLNECEDHLVMDSVMFHYLFIERHSMVDNVAKNTFWSSGDAIHWDLTKNYDNDTADGNDNQGKLTLSYGLEPGDIKPVTGDSYFNAPGAVWLEFARRLADSTVHSDDSNAAGVLFRALEAKGAWDADAYCQEFDDWQATIPERCWIEAFYRLYRRPLEVYADNRFVSMLDGGKKTHQRKQYENYQEMYISSKYFGTVCSNAQLMLRPTADRIAGYTFPLSVYADCYVKAGVGQGTGVGSINYTRKVRRNDTVDFISPIDDATNATMYLYPGSFYQEVGDEENENNLGIYKADQLGFANAAKLRKLVLGAMQDDGSYIRNTSLKGEAISFVGNTLLEELYIVGYEAAESALTLTECPNLQVLDARKSGFTGYLLPNGAPMTTILIEKPTSISASNLSTVTNFSIADYTNMQSLQLINVDNSTGLNSLTILKNSKDNTTSGTFAYNLQQVIWNETNEDAIVDQRIPYLDWLLTKTPQNEKGDTVETRSALSGKLEIAATAYNSTDSDDIYDYYCCNTNADGNYRFPNLDIVFKGSNASMPMITILDQAGDIKWQRRVANDNTGFDENFFAAGPNGAFTPFTTTSDISSVYEFTNRYKINGVETEASANGYPVYNSAITADMIIEPIFEVTVRKYTVTVKGPNNETLHQGEYDYGTMLSETVAGILPPGKNSSDLDFYYVYQFKGYKIDSNEIISSLEDLAKAELRSDRILTAGYEPTHVYANPMSADYFNTISNDGYLNLKSDANITLQDKITVPKQVMKNGNPVTVTGLGTGCFQHSASAQKYTSGITHIFFEPDEFIDATHFTPNSNIKHLGMYSCSTSPSSTIFIELPINIDSTIEDYGWTGSNSNVVVILNPAMQKIADHLFTKFQGKLCMNSNIGISGTAITEINLPNVSYIGKNSFKEAGNLTSVNFVFSNKVEFGGALDSRTDPAGSGFNSITFGASGDTAPEIKFNDDNVTTTDKAEIADLPNGIYKSKKIVLYGEGASTSDSYEFIQAYFKNAEYQAIDS